MFYVGVNFRCELPRHNKLLYCGRHLRATIEGLFRNVLSRQSKEQTTYKARKGCGINSATIPLKLIHNGGPATTAHEEM